MTPPTRESGTPARAEQGVVRRDARRNREAVIDAALALFATEPDASMATIAARSGVGRTTVYRHFSNRQELIRAIFERVVEEATEATGAVVARGGPATTTLHDLGPTIVEISERFRFLASARSLGLDVIERSTTDPNQPVRSFVTAAQARGEIRRDLPVQWILSAMNALGLAASTELNAGRVDAATAGRNLGETFVAAFATDAASP